MDLFAQFNQIFSDSVIDNIAKNNKENPEKVKKAASILPASLMAYMMKRVTTESGMNLVYNYVQDSQDKNYLDFTNKTATETTVIEGDKVLNKVLPSAKGPVIGLVSKYSGLRNSLVTQLCTLSLPSILTVLKKIVAERKLDAAGLAQYILEQREGLVNTLPDDIKTTFVENLGLSNYLGVITLPNIANGEDINLPTKTVERNIASEPMNIGPLLKWGAVALLVGGLSYAAYYFWNNRSQATTTNEEAEAQVITEPAVQDTTTRDTTQKSTATMGTVTNDFDTYLADTSQKVGKTLKWSNVDFEDNTTKIKAASVAEITNLVNILKKRPTSQVKIIAYANDAILPMTNKMLSVKRVYALKQMLVDGGINFVRVDVEGRGDGTTQKVNASTKPLREMYVKFISK
jgi:outer membrane protein OmpA-like peptidoglycan-associated protein